MSENSAASRSGFPNSFTNSAPDTLNRSVIVVFIAASSWNDSRVIFCSLRPTRLAGKTNAGSTNSASRVSRHSRANIATRVIATVIAFETTWPSVPVSACCAPITSLFMRLTNAPVWVRVKKARGMRWTWS